SRSTSPSSTCRKGVRRPRRSAISVQLPSDSNAEEATVSAPRRSVMEPSMASSAARAQGLPLWAPPSAWRRKANPHRFRDGTASRATPNAGRAPARLGSTSPPRPTHRELWRAIPKPGASRRAIVLRSEEHTSELQSRGHLVCRLLLEKKKYDQPRTYVHQLSPQLESDPKLTH